MKGRHATPVFRVRAASFGLTVFVRPPRRGPGFYVDAPVWADPGPSRLTGRTAAIRAAQHRARRPEPPRALEAKEPDTSHRTSGFLPGAPLLGLTARGHAYRNVGVRHRNATYTVGVPSYAGGGAQSWRTYVYRGRRAALRGWQQAAHHTPDGHVGEHRHTEHTQD